MKHERENNEHTIVFCQTFYPMGEEDKPLFVVVDTSPTFNPKIISASQVVVENEMERIGMPGGIDPLEVFCFRDIWDIERIIKAMSAQLGGKLSKDIEVLLRECSVKPPRIV